MKFVVNWLQCDGNGLCTAEAPELLAMNDEDMLEIVREEFGEEFRAKAEAAVKVCPKHALKLQD